MVLRNHLIIVSTFKYCKIVDIALKRPADISPYRAARERQRESEREHCGRTQDSNRLSPGVIQDGNAGNNH